MRRYKKIERFGRYYVKDLIGHQVKKKNTIYKDWYEALLFFFGKSFYRGRKDEISYIFEKRALAALDEYRIRDKFPHFRKTSLEKILLKNKVNNRVDRKMVIQTLEFIKKLESYNIVKHSVNQIKRGSTEDLFKALLDIYGIGDKLAGLFLRDVVFVYELEKYLKPDELKYFQPIDTWVKQVATQLNIIDKDENNIENIKSKIIQRCAKEKVSSLLVNAGAWYLGANSFKIALDNL